MGAESTILLGTMAANALVGFLAGIAPVISRLMAGGEATADDLEKLARLESAEWIQTGAMLAALNQSIAAREVADNAIAAAVVQPVEP